MHAFSEKEAWPAVTDVYKHDVIIVGGGGAGLVSAVPVHFQTQSTGTDRR